LSFLEGVAGHYQWVHILEKLALVCRKSGICPLIYFSAKLFLLGSDQETCANLNQKKYEYFIIIALKL
jgi:hypothetical protein